MTDPGQKYHKRPDVKKHAPGLTFRTVMFRWQVGRKGLTRHLPTRHGQLSPAQPRLFFFGVSEPTQRAVLVPFFWGGVYDLFFPQICFLDLRRISVGVFSELKI